MTTKPSREDLQSRYDQVPADFPRPGIASSVAGFQAKLAMVSYEGKFYLPGCTPPELFQRWDICEDLAQQCVVKAKSDKVGKRSHMSETEILENYLARLPGTGWCSPAEAIWIIQRTAALLGWPMPEAGKP